MGGASGLSIISWTRALMPFMRMVPNDHFLRPPPPNSITLEIRLQHWNFVAGQKHSMGSTENGNHWLENITKFWIPGIKSVKTDPSPGKWTGCTLGLNWRPAPRYLPGPLLTSFKFLLNGSSGKGFSLTTTHHFSPPDCSPLPTLFLSSANEVWPRWLTLYIYLLLCWQSVSWHQNGSLLKADYFSVSITSWSWY